ncbi:hypothetical protein [Schlesneria paludicola]|uniref:hypothetical protein n=1 Tax=Schlesneria paludicola TaxID=360056 RepID=UPI00029ACA42|nr:hypothetical protein [Schlesneria paludicola]
MFPFDTGRIRLALVDLLALTVAGLFSLSAIAADQPYLQPPKPLVENLGVVHGDTPSSNSPLDGPAFKDAPSWTEALRVIVLTAIPDQYEDRQHWDKTNEIFDGFRVKQRGFDIRVSERKRTVKHGAWHKYKIELIDPVNTLKLVIDQFQTVSAKQFRFSVNLASKLRCRADFEHWMLGVKGFNMTVVSEADVRIVARCSLTIRPEMCRKSLLPDLILEPRVNEVHLILTGLDVKRIGEIRGDIAETIGDGSRSFIESVMHAQESRVLKKANEALQKKSGSLRIPTSKLW